MPLLMVGTCESRPSGLPLLGTGSALHSGIKGCRPGTYVAPGWCASPIQPGVLAGKVFPFRLSKLLQCVKMGEKRPSGTSLGPQAALPHASEAGSGVVEWVAEASLLVYS